METTIYQYKTYLFGFKGQYNWKDLMCSKRATFAFVISGSDFIWWSFGTTMDPIKVLFIYVVTLILIFKVWTNHCWSCKWNHWWGKPKTSTGVDSVSNKLIKCVSNVISKPLSTIMNQMLGLGILPDSLKITKVVPKNIVI